MYINLVEIYIKHLVITSYMLKYHELQINTFDIYRYDITLQVNMYI